ncbi:MAG: HEPN domain-containing protein, partial [Coleofasciculus sp. C2-GNP5-27]
MSGLSAKDRIDFSNGVSILPLDQAGNAPQVEWFRSLSLAHPLQNVLGTHFNAVACKETKHDRTEEVPKRPIDHEVITAVEEVLIGCALNDGLAPALTLHWTEFVDPKLRAADVSWGTNGFPQDAPVAFGRLVLSEDIPNVELFLGLEDGFKRKMRVALSRVGLARRRSTSANKAIEYSIALEALLSDGNSEMTHKIATRAAIILSKDLKERIHYRKLIK